MASKVGHSKIPKSWLNYSKLNNIVSSTRLLPFKTPMSRNIFELNDVGEDERFMIKNLVDEVERKGFNLGMVIDLCSSTPYYNPKEFQRRGIKYVKIRCKLHSLQSSSESFIQTVSKFLENNVNDNVLIGVHCLHGLNRTGYMICAYLIKTKRISSNEALQLFEDARGHTVESSRNLILSIC